MNFDITTLEQTISSAWDNFGQLDDLQKKDLAKIIHHIFEKLDDGFLRVCEKKGPTWIVNEWIKKAILLSFRIIPNKVIRSGELSWFDKVPLRTRMWDEQRFMESQFRSVPGSIQRTGSFVAKNVILMPSFINVGAYVGEGTMVDTWATIGSCAQIGKNCHISGGVGIGGVLEPLQASPVIIEDNCFIGARSEVAEGVLVEEGSVISMGVFLGASTKIVDRQTGATSYGKIPAYSVVVPGSLASKNPEQPHLNCAVIVKRVDERTRSKTSINDLLRE